MLRMQLKTALFMDIGQAIIPINAHFDAVRSLSNINLYTSENGVDLLSNFNHLFLEKVERWKIISIFL